MKKSLIWITAGVAGIGFGIPAFAAMSPQDDHPVTTTPTVVSTPEHPAGDDSATSLPSTPAVISLPVVTAATNAPLVTTANSIEDVSGSCSEPGETTDDRCTGVDTSEDTNNATVNGVEDLSGPCDEAEHANDPSCSGSSPVTSTDDQSGRGGSGRNGADDGADHGQGSDSDG